MPSLENQKNQETNPDDQQGLLLSLMAEASRFKKTRDMHKIVNSKKKSIESKIASLQELVKEARREAKEQVTILTSLALPKADFRILRNIMRNSDVTKVRQELMELLDEKKIPYRHLL